MNKWPPPESQTPYRRTEREEWIAVRNRNSAAELLGWLRWLRAPFHDTVRRCAIGKRRALFELWGGARSLILRSVGSGRFVSRLQHFVGRA
jgi:hypothetical protein